MKTRIEKDPMGEREVPADAYYGIQTARAIENFPISGLKPFPAFVKATALIKLAAARVNARAGALKPKLAQAIEKAAQEVVEGKLADQFVVDVFQAGAGTSHNMNVNEVIANRANELIGLPRGDTSQIHPNDHVNLGQSTNDVIPTAMRLSALELSKPIAEVTRQAAATLQEKAHRFSTVVKSGRTHLQDAAPMMLGQREGHPSTPGDRRERRRHRAQHPERLSRRHGQGIVRLDRRAAELRRGLFRSDAKHGSVCGVVRSGAEPGRGSDADLQ